MKTSVHLSILVCAWLFLALGCTSSLPPTPVGPPPAEVGWVQSFLGATADVVVFARPEALRRDPRWGPIFREGNVELFDAIPHSDESNRLSRESKARLNLAREIEIYGALRSFSFDSANSIGYLSVLRGMPVTDPLFLRSESGSAIWTAPLRLASGALEYRPTASYADATKGLAPTIYITTDGTWMFVDQVTAARAHDLLGRNGGSPPSLAPSADVLIGGGLGMTAVSFVVSSSEKTGSLSSMTHGLQYVGAALHGGEGASVELFGTYASSSDASSAFDAYEAICKNGASCAVPAFIARDLKVERDGRRITWRLYPSEAIFRTIAEQANKR